MGAKSKVTDKDALPDKDAGLSAAEQRAREVLISRAIQYADQHVAASDYKLLRSNDAGKSEKATGLTDAEARIREQLELMASQRLASATSKSSLGSIGDPLSDAEMRARRILEARS